MDLGYCGRGFSALIILPHQHLHCTLYSRREKDKSVRTGSHVPAWRKCAGSSGKVSAFSAIKLPGPLFFIESPRGDVLECPRFGELEALASRFMIY